MTGLPEQETTQDRSQHVVEGLTGWHGQGLSELARMIGSDPHLEGKTFGEIGSPDHPTVYGYTQQQLAGVLERWELELTGTEKKTGGHLFDRPHWELASLEAVQAMAGKSREPLSTTIDSRITTLQETLMESRTGVEKNNAVSQDIVPAERRSIPWIRGEMRRVQAEQQAREVFNTVGSFVYAIVKRPHVVLSSFALAACSMFGEKTSEAATSTPSFQTSEPTLAPTADAPTLTPKPPEDPFKGMPDGTNRVENNVPYMDKTENGKTVTYEWRTIKIGENELSDWFTSHVENGSMDGGTSIPLMFKINSMPWSINVKYGVEGVPIFRQVDNFVPTKRSLNGVLWPILYDNRAYTELAGYQEFYEALKNKDPKAASKFTIADGVVREWMYWMGYELNWVSPEDMEAIGGYFETKDYDAKIAFGYDITYSWIITTTPDGRLIAVGSMKYENPEVLDDKQAEHALKLALRPMLDIFEWDGDLPAEIPGWGPHVIVSNLLKPDTAPIVELEFPPQPLPSGNETEGANEEVVAAVR